MSPPRPGNPGAGQQAKTEHLPMKHGVAKPPPWSPHGLRSAMADFVGPGGSWSASTASVVINHPEPTDPACALGRGAGFASIRPSVCCGLCRAYQFDIHIPFNSELVSHASVQ
jgi:hypothetical protein